MSNRFNSTKQKYKQIKISKLKSINRIINWYV